MLGSYMFRTVLTFETKLANMDGYEKVSLARLEIFADISLLFLSS